MDKLTSPNLHDDNRQIALPNNIVYMVVQCSAYFDIYNNDNNLGYHFILIYFCLHVCITGKHRIACYIYNGQPFEDNIGDYVNSHCIIYIVDVYITVPTPTMSVTALNPQIEGQSLTLQCEVTTVRGITSRVDIVWSNGGTVSRRIEGVSSTTLVYTDSYNISQLSTTDEGRVIQCEGVINANPTVMGSDSITLNVIGEY